MAGAEINCSAVSLPHFGQVFMRRVGKFYDALKTMSAGTALVFV